MKQIDIVLPVLNEEEVINDFNEALLTVINPLKKKYEFNIIYVLDKSTDDSLNILKEICNKNKNVKLIALSNRFGYENSIIAGMDNCTGGAVIMMDSDLEHPPELIPQLLEKFEEGYDIVHTSRVYSKKISIFKRITSNLFHTIMRVISSTNTSLGDYRLISNMVLRVFQQRIREQNQFLKGLFQWVGFKSTYVNYVTNKRKKGRTKFTLARLITMALHGIISFSKVPLKISIFIGFIISIISIIYGIYILVDVIFGGAKVIEGWTSLTLLILFFGGIHLIFLGVIGEYIGAILDEVKKRPHYIIEEEYKGDLKVDNK